MEFILELRSWIQSLQEEKEAAYGRIDELEDVFLRIQDELSKPKYAGTFLADQLFALSESILDPWAPPL